ncbi:cAMP-binding domain of CRP or a regulatory subunit of cAMP-dependent protein kinases [Palleronia marisminoris]|uniref:Crp/Fnr family transcriptional regulator n=1 Tax=Palleronia marisminoris TaxID=315423 RepID=UPI0008DF163C|nr:Crp/Fnr family transcriptional regulator [Palleronia marisminoris]SFH26449.1 cAMP-binding domain of CRP or a regulatory subunit of cAMP-dependent protein kinases [Palleronia marisminoris]
MPKRLPCAADQNNILATLSSDDRALIEPCLEFSEFHHGMVLQESGKAEEQVFFFSDGVGSMIAIDQAGRRIEAGLFGREGMSGIAVVMGGTSTHLETVVQIAGRGCAISADDLRTLFAQSSTLRDHLLLYIHAQFVQTSQTALSNGRGRLEERLARWLLMCHDRMDGDRLELTHDFLAVMLGVRRAGVTVGTHLLEGKGLIQAKRGEITVLDRDGLEDEAKGSYGVAEAEYERLLGRPKPEAA